MTAYKDFFSLLNDNILELHNDILEKQAELESAISNLDDAKADIFQDQLYVKSQLAFEDMFRKAKTEAVRKDVFRRINRLHDSFVSSISSFEEQNIIFQENITIIYNFVERCIKKYKLNVFTEDDLINIKLGLFGKKQSFIRIKEIIKSREIQQKSDEFLDMNEFFEILDFVINFFDLKYLYETSNSLLIVENAAACIVYNKEIASYKGDDLPKFLDPFYGFTKAFAVERIAQELETLESKFEENKKEMDSEIFSKIGVTIAWWAGDFLKLSSIFDSTLLNFQKKLEDLTKLREVELLALQKSKSFTLELNSLSNSLLNYQKQVKILKDLLLKSKELTTLIEEMKELPYKKLNFDFQNEEDFFKF